MRQNVRLGDRDGGSSTKLDGKSYWIFADTQLKDPWGMYSSSAAVTTDLDAQDGIDLQSGSAFSTAPATPGELIPHTETETAFEKAHNKALTGCTGASDPYCGVTFAYWPGAAVADPVGHRILVTYGKLCRGGDDGTPCSGWLGKGLGTGVAAIDPVHKTVTRLPGLGRASAARSVEGDDPTIVWGDGSDPVQTGRTSIDGVLYTSSAAKVPLAQINDLKAYRYWNGSDWVVDHAQAVQTGANDGSAGHSVFYSAALKTWVNMYIPFATNHVMYQVAGQPMGPWSAEHLAFDVPPGDGTVYGLEIHSEYATKNGATQFATWYDHQTGQLGLAKVALTKS